MNKIKLIVALTLMFSSQVFAWSYMQAQIQVTPVYASGVVYNTYNVPITCKGRLFTMTSQGFWLVAITQANTVIAPGLAMRMDASTSMFDPFVDARAEIYCRL